MLVESCCAESSCAESSCLPERSIPVLVGQCKVVDVYTPSLPYISPWLARMPARLEHQPRPRGLLAGHPAARILMAASQRLVGNLLA